MVAGREFDVVLLGATGYAGRLTAEYLAEHSPPGMRWALAGRSEEKLDGVRAALLDRSPSLTDLPLLQADVTDAASLRRLAERTHVLITTVGPYMEHGEAAVAACALAGTDYLDLTGEPEFVDRSFVRHHENAVTSGARLIHAAGFDSIPYDLGTLFTVLQLPEGVPVHVDGYVRGSMRISGGTLASALGAFGRPVQNLRAARARSAREQAPGSRRISSGAGRPGRDPLNGGWALPLPTLDPRVVAQSARALARYGPDFTYRHHLSVARLSTALAGPVALASVVAAAQLPPARRLIQRQLARGDGPTLDERQASWFAVTFVGEGGGERVVTRVSGGDPGYDETAKMLGEAALSLLYDDLPEVHGQVTTAVAFGTALIDRLDRAGLSFEVIEHPRPWSRMPSASSTRNRSTRQSDESRNT
jgi:short subunit dehydrogenase-like uncharacterized protein